MRVNDIRWWCSCCGHIWYDDELQAIHDRVVAQAKLALLGPPIAPNGPGTAKLFGGVSFEPTEEDRPSRGHTRVHLTDGRSIVGITRDGQFYFDESDIRRLGYEEIGGDDGLAALIAGLEALWASGIMSFHVRTDD
jgi:hypothetical protein